MDACTWELIRKRFDAIDASIADVKAKQKLMEDKIMAQLDDLNAAIQAEDVQVTTLATSITKIDADVDALVLAAQKAGVPTDLTNQILAIQSHTSALSTAVAQLAADDTKANPTV